MSDPGCILFEDEHLLIVNKPAGISTHRATPYTTDGIYEWLKGRKSEWVNLSTLHRLDKETSGVLLFGKTRLANQSLGDQFAKHIARKTYVFLTDRPVQFNDETVRTTIIKKGNRHLCQAIDEKNFSKTDYAETHFRLITQQSRISLIEAEPLTGRTHQIRLHANWLSIPIIGDELYNGTSAGRLFLHASELLIFHPVTKEKLIFKASSPFSPKTFLKGSDILDRLQISLLLRKAFLNQEDTNAYRLFHSTADGISGLYVEKYADNLLIQTESEKFSPVQQKVVQYLANKTGISIVRHKTLLQSPGGKLINEASPVIVPELTHCQCNIIPATTIIKENGTKYGIAFNQGYSVGIFLDQRENRQRILGQQIAPSFPLLSEETKFDTKPRMLNLFAYTCAFSVCAAKSGFITTSLDLSKKYLDWGKQNMLLNGINPEEHDFIFGDIFSWRKRLSSKDIRYNLIVIDPPTFSHSKESGTFKAQKDIGKLASEWIPLLAPHGTLLISTNCAILPPDEFMEMMERAILPFRTSKTKLLFVTQPFDFPACPEEKAYLKTLWIQF